MSEHTLCKSDRLKNKQQIEQLFVHGNSFTEFPLKVFWRWTESKGTCVRIALSVPKKKLPKAVNRTYMKRLLRESYRQQNQGLKLIASEKGKQLQMMFIFLGTQQWSFSEIDNKISVTLERLKKQL